MKNIVIIGAGYGGLTAAALLGKEGHQVTVIEKNEQPGGKASLLEKDGFSFDMGPQVFDDFFAEFGKDATRDDIVVKSLFTHRDFKERYNAYKGTGLGMAHTLWQSAVFRPKHKSSKVKNLYYTGQYNHPGVGVPTTVISSQILVKELKKMGVLS